MEDRSWAVGMSQEQFNTEFPLRTGLQGFVPEVEIYTSKVPKPKKVIPVVTPLNDDVPPVRGIDFGIEDLEKIGNQVYHTIEEPKIEIREHLKEVKCQYCGAECRGSAGRAAHERHCKSKPKLTTEENTVYGVDIPAINEQGS